jgi:DNA-binding PadR family transcriptional regulator
VPTELFLVENKRKEKLFREAFPEAAVENLAHEFHNAYWLVCNGARPKELGYQEKQQSQIDQLRQKAAVYSTIYLAFDPEHEDMAAACALALETLRPRTQTVRLRPNSLHPFALRSLLLEATKTTREKAPPFQPLENQRAIARKLLHIETARRLKTIAIQSLRPLTLAQALLLEIISKHEQQEKGFGGLLETWREISIQVQLPSQNSGHTETLTAQLIVPDKAVAYTEENPDRKQVWEQLSALGKQNQKKNRVHHEFYRMQQGDTNTSWRFADLEEAYQTAQQLQANPRLALSVAYNEPALHKILPPHHTASLYQSSGPVARYINYLHQVLHEDLYQNGLITYPETQSNRFPDSAYYQLVTYRTLLKPSSVLVHRPFENPQLDKGQIAILPAQWSIDTVDKLRNYLGQRNEYYSRNHAYAQIIWEIYHDIYRRALTSQIDFSRQSTDYLYFIGPADPAHPSGINPNASHDQWIFLAKKDVPPNSASLLKTAFCRSGHIFHAVQPALRQVRQIKPPAEVSNLLQICKEWEICAPQQLRKHLNHLLKEGLLQTADQTVSSGAITVYRLTEAGKSHLKLYKERAPTAVNLNSYRKFHAKLKGIIAPVEAKTLLTLWLQRLEKEIKRENKVRREPDKEQLKKIATD